MQRARGTPGTSWGTLPATSSQDPEPQHSPALGATPAQSWDVKPAKVTMGWGEQSQFLFSLFFFCFYPLICTVVYSGIGASLVAQTVKIYLQCRRPGGGKIPWRRAWQATPVFLPGTEESSGLQMEGVPVSFKMLVFSGCIPSHRIAGSSLYREGTSLFC